MIKFPEEKRKGKLCDIDSGNIVLYMTPKVQTKAKLDQWGLQQSERLLHSRKPINK